ncbi:MAG: hypothetical protein K2K84_09450 [Muribaculaceae bacterium]|nr:hypothetical protein [Muribaculaceae bacterium]
MKKQTDAVELAHALWSARSALTAKRERLKQFTYGDQWRDTVRDSDGVTLSERDMLLKEGMRPLTNNLIRRLVKTIVGRYRDVAETAGWYDPAPDGADSAGLHDELDSRLLEEFLISGQAIQRVADDNPLGNCRPTAENVSPDVFFVNDFRDPRGYDVDVVGMLHDMSPGEMMMRFGTTRGRRDEIDGIISRAATEASECGLSFSARNTEPAGVSFRRARTGRVRVIELWTREYFASMNDDSAGPGLVWRCRWLTPDGLVLGDYRSPWRHGRHPFVFKFYPLIDGEIHPFVEDLVGQQQHINRLIVLIDRVMSSSAKGVLLYPVNQLPRGLTLQDVAENWASPTGILPITGAPGPLPQQMATNGGDTQAHRLLEIELKLFQDSSGVSDALSGASVTGGNTGADLYRQQVTNATIALADILKTFRSGIAARDRLLSAL